MGILSNGLKPKALIENYNEIHRKNEDHGWISQI
jgi:hypothetical protein